MDLVRTSRRVAAIVVVASVLAGLGLACGSFGEGSSDVTPAAEAGATDEAAAAIPDAMTDAAAPTPGYCASSDAAFCADFDDGGLEGNWTRFNRDAGTLSLDGVLASSRPSSMHLMLDPNAPWATDCEYARAVRVLSDVVPSSIGRLGLDVWVGPAAGDPASPVPNLSIAAMSTASGCNLIASLGTADCLLRVEQYTDAGTISLQSAGLFPVPHVPKWSRVELLVSVLPAGATASYSVDGQPCGTPIVLPAQCAVATSFTILPGFYCLHRSLGGVVEANVDNVEFRRE